MERIPVIDYGNHPYFCHYNVPQIDESKELSQLTHRIVEDFTELRHHSDRGAIPLELLERNTRHQHESMKQLHQCLLSSRSDWTAWDLETLGKLVGRIKLEHERFMYFLVQRAKHIGYIPAHPNNDMSKNGYSIFQLEESEREALLKSLQKPIQKLRSLDTGGKDKQVNPAVSLERDIRLLGFQRLLRRILHDRETTKMASAYLQCPVTLTAINLHMNRPGDKWWSERYADLGHKASQTANLHYDSNSGMVKCMIYLNDVGPDSGPFSFVRSTNRLPMGLLQRIVGQAMAYAGVTFANEAQRKFLLKLPKSMQFLSHFGDDLLDGSDEQNWILSHEEKFVSKNGNIILFDNYGLHRGGLSASGERIALQAQFSPAWRYIKETATNMFRKLAN